MSWRAKQRRFCFAHQPNKVGNMQKHLKKKYYNFIIFISVAQLKNQLTETKKRELSY